MNAVGAESMMAMSGESEFTLNDYKIDFNVPSNASSPQLLSRTDYQMLDPMKPYIKEEPIEVATSCSQLSPLSPTSSGLGSSLHSQSPSNNMANYFASLNNAQQQQQQQQQLQQHHQALTSNNSVMYGVLSNSTSGDPILTAASINIKNEAFSPQSMDICN